jgi:hypothetical protein
MKKKSSTRYKAAAVLILSLFFIAGLSSTTTALSYEKTGFSCMKTPVSIGNGDRVEEEIKYYNPDALTNVIGIGDAPMPFKWQSAIRLTQDELAAYDGWTITKVNAGYSADNGQSVCDARIIIYGEGDAAHPGEVLCNDTTFFFEASGVFTIPLNTHIELGSYNELWVAVEWEQTEAAAFLAVMDEGPAVDGKSDWGFDGNWSELQIYGLDYNWAIGAIVEGSGSAELMIQNVKGPLGIAAEVKNVGVIPAENLDWEILVKGGILQRVNKSEIGHAAEVAVDGIEAISLGTFLGLGKIQITIRAKASNAAEVVSIKSAVLLGPFVVGIK